jgi:hypothetical protein
VVKKNKEEEKKGVLELRKSDLVFRKCISASRKNVSVLIQTHLASMHQHKA